MAACLWKSCTNGINNKINYNLVNSIRYGHHLRGKAPGVARSLQQRLDELNYKDLDVSFRVDIGFPKDSVCRSKELFKRLDHLKKNHKDFAMEKLAREKQLYVNLDEVKEEWLKTGGSYHIRKIADHFSVFEHLFGDAYFNPRVPLSISYQNDDLKHPVFYGNVIKPSDATEQPSVVFESDENSLWTLVLTNPDGHLSEKNSEYIHWFIGNIPGNAISKGETLIEYLQPFPPRGTGYHRHIFILYKQSKKLDFSSLKCISSPSNLHDRTFSTLDFYRERQNVLTPAGLAFFQSDWDQTLTDFYQKKLDIPEPVFEYDFPAPYIRPQKWFPLRQPFNLYMDKYKDSKKVAERYFKDKLKEVHPFKTPTPRLPFPNAEPISHTVPSWLKLEIRKKRMGWGRVNDV